MPEEIKERLRLEENKVEDNKIFIPHELKTVEIDVEEKILRVNGEDFGKRCDEFYISCSTKRDREPSEFLKVDMRIGTQIVFGDYDNTGKKTNEGSREGERICPRR